MKARQENYQRTCDENAFLKAARAAAKPTVLLSTELPVCSQCGERGLHGGNQDACIAALRLAITAYPARNDRMVA
jgi:hypothetical protein